MIRFYSEQNFQPEKKILTALIFFIKVKFKDNENFKREKGIKIC